MSDESVTPSNPFVDIAAVRASFARGVPVADLVFDRIYPAAQRYRSRTHWTPTDTALLASKWLATARDVLDVGSGVGKACHVAALASDVNWTGIERDEAMVRIATRVSRDLGVESRTNFICGEALDLDWSPYGGVYLFNPFLEAVYAATPSDPDMRRVAYASEVSSVETKLLTLEPGARVVTYHGFGGEMPVGFDLLTRVPLHDNFVCLWARA